MFKLFQNLSFGCMLRTSQKNLANQRELVFLRNASHRSSVKRAQLLLNENNRASIDAVSMYVMCAKNMFCLIICCVTCKRNHKKTTILYFMTLRQTSSGEHVVNFAVAQYADGWSLCLKGTVHCNNFVSLHFP